MMEIDGIEEKSGRLHRRKAMELEMQKNINLLLLVQELKDKMIQDFEERKLQETQQMSYSRTQKKAASSLEF